jgi:hypothetical protein
MDLMEEARNNAVSMRLGARPSRIIWELSSWQGYPR